MKKWIDTYTNDKGVEFTVGKRYILRPKVLNGEMVIATLESIEDYINQGERRYITGVFVQTKETRWRMPLAIESCSIEPYEGD